MGYDESRTKTLKDLRKGDIVFMGIPFEENTKDYYNGYDPKEIRGYAYRDKDGQTSKSRFVVVVGKDENNIMYLPLTSRRARFDDKHQYELQDNSMTYKKSPDMRSYVEIDSLRSVYTNPKWNLEFVGQVADNDMINIMSQLGRRALDLDSRRDQRAYVSRGKESSFEKRLGENGYKVSNADYNETTYMKEDGRTITKSRWGLVKYHVPLSKEEVTELVAARENKPVEYYTRSVAKREQKDRQRAGNQAVDDFTRAVTDITEKSAKKESGVTQ